MKTLYIGISSIFLTTALHADSIEERRIVASEIVELSEVNGYDVANFRKSIAIAMDAEGRKRKSKVAPEEVELRKKAMEQAAAELTNERLVAVFAEAYAKQLSLEDLEGILAFYKTEPGKALLRERKAINGQKLAQSNILVAELVADSLTRFEELKKE